MALAPTDVASVEESTAIRLVAAHRSGDPDAFAEIVRTYYPSLLATARNRLGNPEDAKDAVQETLLRALLALDRFGDTGDWRLGSWLNTVLIHVCVDIPVRRKPALPLSDSLIESHPEEREEVTSDHVALEAVRRAIHELPASQRRAFELRLVDGRPYDEVAGALGITEVNARARVRRARAALQHALQDKSAVKGAWVAVPLLLTAPVRAALRRVFVGAGDSARAAGSQVVASGAAATGSSAASVIAGTPVETGIQLITQVSTTPLAQAAVASATSVPGKGSVVLGIVASLATAGGLAAPAAISGSAAPQRSGRPPVTRPADAAPLLGSAAAAAVTPSPSIPSFRRAFGSGLRSASALSSPTSTSSLGASTSTSPLSASTSASSSGSPMSASSSGSGMSTSGSVTDSVTDAVAVAPASSTTFANTDATPAWVTLAASGAAYQASPTSNASAPPTSTSTSTATIAASSTTTSTSTPTIAASSTTTSTSTPTI
ncbi:MAG: RNA polymerase sigma factor, partial [Nitrososphaerales archaeon]